MKIFQTVRRVIQVAASGNGFLASVINAGVSLANRFSLLAGTVVPGIQTSISEISARPPTQVTGIDTDLVGAIGSTSVTDIPAVQSAASLTSVSPTAQTPAATVVQSLRLVDSTSTTQRPAVDTDLLSVVGVAAVSTTLPAAQMGARISEFHLDTTPASEIVQIVYNLTRRVGGDVAANVTGTWTTLTNAQGIHDDADATSAGAALGATRKMSLGYANHTNKTALTIASVKLFLYIQSAGNVEGLLGSVTFAYNIGAGEVIPTGWNTRNDTFDFTTTPAEVDITTAIGGDWSKLDSLQTFVTHVYATASLSFVCSVDAVEVEVIATATQIP